MRRSKATSIADLLASNPTRYRFVAGKGGVGKTTCAAALAVRCARLGLKTLVISTDPAPSLADALRQPLAARPRPVRGLPRLHAVEVDGREALQTWIAGRQATLRDIALRGTWLDRDDVEALLRLSLPGIDEIAALLRIIELADDDRYARVIVDTAPTGHFLRMLQMPSLLQGLAAVFDQMQAKHRVMVDALRGRWTPDAADRLIEAIQHDAERAAMLIRDPSRAGTVWVTLPELMAVEETLDGLDWLSAHGIGVDAVIVNRATSPPPSRCRWCEGRRRVERQALDLLRGDPRVPARVTILPFAPREPRGLGALDALARANDRFAPASRPPGQATAAVTARPAAAAAGASGPPPAPESGLVLVGGKGGVGKTTCAAAMALDAATARAGTRVLLLSADPAHSIADALGQPVSDVAAPVRGGPPNLFVRELHADRIFDSWRGELTRAVDALFDRSGNRTAENSIVAQDRQVIRNLLDLAPPGIDELVAVMEVVDALLSGAAGTRFDLVIIDTAPTGHALRLIEMPALVHAWVKAVMAILLKYRAVVGPGALGALLLRLSQGLGRLRAVMTDGSRTRFVVVTRAAALPRAETVRLIERLHDARITVPVVILNALGAGTCRRCLREARAQERELAALRTDLARLGRQPAMIVSPARVPPPHGPDGLLRWQAGWARLPDRRQPGRRGRLVSSTSATRRS